MPFGLILFPVWDDKAKGYVFSFLSDSMLIRLGGGCCMALQIELKTLLFRTSLGIFQTAPWLGVLLGEGRANYLFLTVI